MKFTSTYNQIMCMFNPPTVHMTLSTCSLLSHLKKEGREGRFNKKGTEASDCIELCLLGNMLMCI